MRVCYLHKKRLKKSKEQVHGESENHSIDIEKQQAVCHFSIAIRSLISKKELSNDQAKTLMNQLRDLFCITYAHIDPARTCTTSHKRLETKSNKIIQLKQMGISAVKFEDHMESLQFFHHIKSLQFKQGLVIATLLLRHYPQTENCLCRQEKTIQKRRLAAN